MSNDFDWLNIEVTEAPKPAAPTPKTKAKRTALKTEVMQIGGLEIEIGTVVSDETRSKLSAAHKGVAKSAQHRASMVRARADKPRVFDDETRAKMSRAAKGRVLSDETRAKMSKAGKGRQASPETRAKLSAAKKGRVLGEETRAKLSAVHTFPIMTPHGLFPNRPVLEQELVRNGIKPYKLAEWMRKYPDHYYYPHKRKASTVVT